MTTLKNQQKDLKCITNERKGKPMGICVQQKLRTGESVGGEERRKAGGELIWLCLGVGGGDVLQGWGELFVHFVSREKSEK